MSDSQSTKEKPADAGEINGPDRWFCSVASVVQGSLARAVRAGGTELPRGWQRRDPSPRTVLCDKLNVVVRSSGLGSIVMLHLSHSRRRNRLRRRVQGLYELIGVRDPAEYHFGGQKRSVVVAS